MGKPLLTDEMIERARRGKDITGPKMVDAEETKIIRTDHRGFGYERPMRESRMEMCIRDSHVFLGEKSH